MSGSKSPDVQASVFIFTGNPNCNTIQHNIQFDSFETAEDFIKNHQQYGIKDLTLIPDTNKVTDLDFDDGIDTKKLLKNYEGRLKKHNHGRVDTRSVEEGSYSEIIRGSRDSKQGHVGGVGGQNYNAILDYAQARADRRSGNTLAKSESEKVGRRKQVADYIKKFASKFGINSKPTPLGKSVPMTTLSKGYEILITSNLS